MSTTCGSAPRGTRRIVAAVSALFLASLSAGCSSYYMPYASGETRDDLVGSWHGVRGVDTVLTLVDDGSFTVSDWPLSVHCVGAPPSSSSALIDAPARDLGGTWDVQDSDGSVRQLQLVFADTCTAPPPLAFLMTVQDDAVGLCFPLDYGIDPDLYGAANTLRFLKAPATDVNEQLACDVRYVTLHDILDALT